MAGSGMSGSDVRYASEAEFRQACTRVFGSEGADLMLDWVDSPVGPLLLGADEQAVKLVAFTRPARIDEQLQQIGARHGSAGWGTNVLTASLRSQLAEYFAGQRREFDLPLAYPGSEFQERVWSMLRQIPYGTTWSYLDVAVRLGDPAATRAVGTTNGMNPIAIVIPCHRVINANGALGGFGGGLWRKQILLDLERGQGRLAL